MPTYTVKQAATWQVGIEADSPQEALQKCYGLCHHPLSHEQPYGLCDVASSERFGFEYLFQDVAKAFGLSYFSIGLECTNPAIFTRTPSTDTITIGMGTGHYYMPAVGQAVVIDDDDGEVVLLVDNTKGARETGQ